MREVNEEVKELSNKKNVTADPLEDKLALFRQQVRAAFYKSYYRLSPLSIVAVLLLSKLLFLPSVCLCPMFQLLLSRPSAFPSCPPAVPSSPVSISCPQLSTFELLHRSCSCHLAGPQLFFRFPFSCTPSCFSSCHLAVPQAVFPALPQAVFPASIWLSPKLFFQLPFSCP